MSENRRHNSPQWQDLANHRLFEVGYAARLESLHKYRLLARRLLSGCWRPRAYLPACLGWALLSLFQHSVSHVRAAEMKLKQNNLDDLRLKFCFSFILHVHQA